jgi:SNF2 family DNA or RNA helicase
LILIDIKVLDTGVPQLQVHNAPPEVELQYLTPRGKILVGPGYHPFVGEILTYIGMHRLTSRARSLLEGMEDPNNPFNDLHPVYSPYLHQVEGLKLMCSRPRLAIFWEPGLGKTYVSCNRILKLRQTHPGSLTLVLALTVNLTTWEREMQLHSRGAEECRIIKAGNKAGRKKKLDKAVKEKVAAIVLTYESAKSSIEDLIKVEYLCIIADECHKMQNPKSGNTKAALKLANKADYRYVLTGTPTKGRPTDAWGFLRFLGSFVVESYYSFYRRHVSTSKYNRHIITGFKGLERVNELLDTVSHSVKNKDAVDLPPRTFQVIPVMPGSKTKRVYNKISNGEGEVSIGKESITIPSVAVSINKLRQVQSGFVYKDNRDLSICDSCPLLASCVVNSIKPYTRDCKVQNRAPSRQTLTLGTEVIDSAVALCQSHILAGKKVILWGIYKNTMEVLHSKLASTNIKTYRYDGTCSDLGSVELSFNEESEPCVILAQVSMGIGVTFKAPIMIYTELPLALDRWLQSLDRNWGIRAKGLGNILVQILIIRNSVNEGIYSLLRSKIDAARIMSDKPDCVTCSEVLTCTAKKPFKGSCIFKNSLEKQTIKKRLI